MFLIINIQTGLLEIGKALTLSNPTMESIEVDDELAIILTLEKGIISVLSV